MSLHITNEIRNKQFINPMESKKMKYFIEQYALAILRYYFDEYDCLISNDAPDLQSPDCSLGVEVTEVTQNINQSFIGDFLQYRKTGDEKYINKITLKGGIANNYSYTLPPVNEKDEFDTITNIFHKKLNKVNQYRNKGFKTLGLVMVMHDPPLPTVANNWSTYIHNIQSNSISKFDIVFFSYPYALSIFNCSTGITEYKIINRNDYDAICKYARVMAEK